MKIRTESDGKAGLQGHKNYKKDLVCFLLKAIDLTKLDRLSVQ